MDRKMIYYKDVREQTFINEDIEHFLAGGHP